MVILVGVTNVFIAGVPRVWADEPEDQRLYLEAIRLYNQQDWNSAKAALIRFQKQFSKSKWLPAVNLRLADLEDSPARALKIYERVLADNPDNEWTGDARWSLASTRFSLGEYALALPLFQQTAESPNPRQAHALYLAGACQILLKKYDEAKISFSRLLEQFPKTFWAGPTRIGLGDVEWAAGRLESASAEYDHYLREWPEGDLANVALWQKSQVMKQQGKKGEAQRVREELATRYRESAGAEASPGRGAEKAEKYLLQVGAFARKKSALSLTRSLKSKGYPAFWTEIKGSTGIFYQVQLGVYNRRETAWQVGKILEKKEKLPFLIHPVPNQGGEKDFLKKKGKP